MNINNTYPPVKKRKLVLKVLLSILRWLALAASVVCPIVNLYTGGKPWSIVVIMGLYMLWDLVLSPDLVEYNRISQFIKLAVCSCILLSLIDFCLVSGLAIRIVPIVAFGSLTVCAVLFFSDLERQKQNMLPMLSYIAFCLVGSVLGLSLWYGEGRWALGVMGLLALALLVACVATLGSEFLLELKRRFHIQ